MMRSEMSPSVRFGDFDEMAIRCKEGGGGLSAFLKLDPVLDLHWPDDVVEQWLFDHPGNGHFPTDYGTIDLTQVRWNVEAVAASVLANLPTGASEGDAIDVWAGQHARNVELRTTGVHAGVGLCWEVHGTWKRWPLLIDRQLLTPATEGLQVIEGRTRVGTMRGRLRDGLFVADRHLAWVARAAV
jgi:hypothetical protein